jgi:acyl carrier protein
MDTQLKELLVERLFLEIDPTDIETETELSEYGVDSFLLLELIVAIEEMFDVRFQQTDITSETLKSIASLRLLIESKKSE